MNQNRAMIKKLLIATLLFSSLSAWCEEEVESEEVSGPVRVVRSSPETEIFFIDRKESVIVPSFHPDHNRAVKMGLDSIKNKKPVSFSVNPTSRRLISAGGKKSSAPAADVDAGEITKPTSSKPASSGFKEIPGDTAQ